MQAILGISAYYHDSAAALLADGAIIAAAQEERFTRIKHDADFPRRAAAYCLQEAGLTIADLQAVVFYDKPLLKFERLLETYLAFAPRGFASFVKAMPIWLKDKLFLKETLRRELHELAAADQGPLPRLLFAEHHRSHAASAFYPSPFRRAAILCLDGVGEWATTSAWHGADATLTPLWQIDFPHSLGLFYSAFTYYTGFRVNSGEYKLMGLAPYGEPRYAPLIRKHLIDIKPDGTFRLNLDYFAYPVGLRMTNRRFDRLFGGPPRQPESPLGQREMDIAASIQQVVEEIVLRLSRTIHAQTGESNLCLAGGVALNCVANGRLLREGPFADLWIQPAAGDAGGALGAALCAWHHYQGQPRLPQVPDAMHGAYLGPHFDTQAIRTYLDGIPAPYQRLADNELLAQVAALLAQGKVIGWFQGRMEFGPRALGARSILGDARNPKMQSALNLKIKYRESFRPFAPAVKLAQVSEWFQLDRASPYMLLVAAIHPDKQLTPSADDAGLTGLARLQSPRSQVPAVTHVDLSARVQTVDPATNPRFAALLDQFEALTGCPVIVNTSFNVRGEPIVCTPEDAYRCFMRTEMDYLVIEDCLLVKSGQPPWQEAADWRAEFRLD